MKIQNNTLFWGIILTAFSMSFTNNADAFGKKKQPVVFDKETGTVSILEKVSFIANKAKADFEKKFRKHVSIKVEKLVGILSKTHKKADNIPSANVLQSAVSLASQRKLALLDMQINVLSAVKKVIDDKKLSATEKSAVVAANIMRIIKFVNNDGLININLLISKTSPTLNIGTLQNNSPAALLDKLRDSVQESGDFNSKESTKLIGKAILATEKFIKEIERTEKQIVGDISKIYNQNIKLFKNIGGNKKDIGALISGMTLLIGGIIQKDNYSPSLRKNLDNISLALGELLAYHLPFVNKSIMNDISRGVEYAPDFQYVNAEIPAVIGKNNTLMLQNYQANGQEGSHVMIEDADAVAGSVSQGLAKVQAAGAEGIEENNTENNEFAKSKL